MDVVTLLDQAKSAGLSVEAHGDQLVVKGPKRAAAIVQELGRHKAAVLAILSPNAAPGTAEPQHEKAASVSGSKPKENEPARPCATVSRSTAVSSAPSETAPATITHNGKTYEVAVECGMWFFRRAPEAGWTACSEGFVAIIENQLQQPSTSRGGRA
jgi:hypothetical protein